MSPGDTCRRKGRDVIDLSVFTPCDGILLVALTYALVTDLRTGLIYNHLTYPTMLAGLALNLHLRGTPGGVDALAGTLLAFALLYVPYSLGWQGAGDVKLMMATGALEGWRFVLVAFLFYMAASFILSLSFIAVKIGMRGREGRDFLTRAGIALAFGLSVDGERDRDMLRSNVKWSPAIFAGTLAALIYLRSFTAGTP